jgi:hypothetical protein
MRKKSLANYLWYSAMLVLAALTVSSSNAISQESNAPKMPKQVPKVDANKSAPAMASDTSNQTSVAPKMPKSVPPKPHRSGSQEGAAGETGPH